MDRQDEIRARGAKITQISEELDAAHPLGTFAMEGRRRDRVEWLLIRILAALEGKPTEEGQLPSFPLGFTRASERSAARINRRLGLAPPEPKEVKP